MPKVKLNDISLYYEAYGSGEPLLLIAGLGSDSASWLGVVKEFSSYFQTIVFDNRACGRSETAQKECTVRRMAQDAIELLDFLEIKQTHVIGHSMGGYIAQELAINYPERINKLILESTAPISSKRNNLLFEEIYCQLKKQGHCRAWFESWVPWLFSPRLISDNAFVNTFIENSVKYPYLQKADDFRSQIEAIASFDARGKISAIKSETLILEGKDDILITPQESETLAKNIPKSIFQPLNGVAHSVHIENPELFINVVLRFLGAKKL
jgi:pimeloyl-ACP methyl ester carboxylesterase